MGNVSLDSDEWKNKAMLVAGLKMLESLNKVGSLKSFIATRQLSNVDMQRENGSENAITSICLNKQKNMTFLLNIERI